MCRNAIPAIYELEHFGVPFSRTEDGRIYQRPFGGHMQEYGKRPAMRACAAADRTGHAILHTLYQQSLKHEVEFFVEYIALDLIMDEEGVCRGVTAWSLEDGLIHRFAHRAWCWPPAATAAPIRAAPRPYLHRRRQRDGDPRRPAHAGHGVRAVPPHRHIQRRLPHYRGCARRGRLPHQFGGRALHGALRPDRQGSGEPRRRLALHDHRDQRRARLRSEQGPHHAPSGASGRCAAA